jgi:hypothetical protein
MRRQPWLASARLLACAGPLTEKVRLCESLKDHKAILAEERVHSLLDRTGFSVNRTGVQLARCRPILQEMIEAIPSLGSGTQAEVLHCYSRVSSLSGFFSASIRDHDNFAPANLKCGGLFDDSFTALKQSSEDLGSVHNLSRAALETLCHDRLDLAKNFLHKLKKIIQLLPTLESR